jgi:hypothetical protein
MSRLPWGVRTLSSSRVRPESQRANSHKNMPSAVAWPCLAVHMDPDGDHPHYTLRLAVDAGIGPDTNGNQEGETPPRRVLAAEAHLLNGEDQTALRPPPSGNTVWGECKSNSAFPFPWLRPLTTGTHNTHALDCTPRPRSHSLCCGAISCVPISAAPSSNSCRDAVQAIQQEGPPTASLRGRICGPRRALKSSRLCQPTFCQSGVAPSNPAG